MAAEVNLDALIPREDFNVVEENAASARPQTVSIRELEKNSFFYPLLRKPDFQRETAQWDQERICQFIQSFLNGDLIPAIILWHSGSYLFVIDGAHRLSALIAWVHDDYGDGETSRRFFQHAIPKEQLEVADKTRRYINKTIGSYEDYQNARHSPQLYSQGILERLRRLGSIALQLQWVSGDAAKAEASFFKINQQAAPIDKTEIKLLIARNKPNALAARAIIRSGTGHKYWSKFDAANREQIEEIAKEIHLLLFSPTLRTPIKTLDLPAAGQSYSGYSLPLVFDLVNIANDIKQDKTNNEIKDDLDGAESIRFLKNTRKIVNRVTGTHPSSLGLHPAVYFYSQTGRYQPGAFLGMALWLKEMEKRNYYSKFTAQRKQFEEFILGHKTFASQATINQRGGYSGAKRLQELYQTILECLIAGKDIISTLQADKRFSFLKTDEEQDIDLSTSRLEFSTETKSATFLRNALGSALRCRICQGLIYSGSISIDHIQRKADGGTGSPENAQLTHPYCNTTVKN